MLTRETFDTRVRPALAAAMSAPRRAVVFAVTLLAAAIAAIVLLESWAGPLSDWWLALPVLAFALGVSTAVHNLRLARAAIRTALFTEVGVTLWPGASFAAEMRLPREWLERSGLFFGASEEELDGLLRLTVAGVEVAISGGTIYAKSGTGSKEFRRAIYSGTLFAAGLGQGARPAVVALSPRDAQFHPRPPALAGSAETRLGVPAADRVFHVQATAPDDAARVFPDYVATALADLAARVPGLRLVVLDNLVVGAIERPPLDLSPFSAAPDLDAVMADTTRIDDVLALVREVAASPVLVPLSLPVR